MGFVEYLKDMGTRLGFLLLGIIILLIALFIITVSGVLTVYSPLAYVGLILGLAVGALGIFTMWYSKDMRRREY